MQRQNALYGFSEWPADRLKAATELLGVERFVSSQPQDSLLWRKPEDKVIPICAANGISQIVWSPHAQGVLTGKYSPEAPPPHGTRVASGDMGGFMDRLMQPRILEAVQSRAGCQEGWSKPCAILARLGAEKAKRASAIVGASRPDQVEENAAAPEVSVDPALFAEAERIVEAAREEPH